MKKILLALLVVLCGSSVTANAQSFTIQADTVWETATVGGVTHVYDTIAAPSPVSLTWRVFSTNFPADWLIDSVLGICDANLCRQNNAMQLWNGTSGTTFTCMYPSAGNSHDFHLQLDLEDVTSVGTYYMVVRVDDGGSGLSKRMTFIVTNGPSSVAGVNNGISNAVVFPNPARGNAHITFSLDEPGTVKCTVYDLTGKNVLDMPAKKMSAGNQQVDIAIPPVLAPGIYTIALTTGKGVLTRKINISK